jgi:hypothetical protein
MDLKNSFNALKQNPIALAISVIGVLAFVYVSILAFQTLTGAGQKSAQKTVEISQEEIDQFKNQEINISEETDTTQRKAKRQRNIKERDVAGVWDTYLGDARVLLQLKDGRFRLILINQNSRNLRYYVNGSYRMEEDIVFFDPDPQSPAPRGDFDYEILTRAEFPVMVSKHRGKMVWMKPSDDVDIYVPNYHVILDRAQNDIAVWSTLK